MTAARAPVVPSLAAFLVGGTVPWSALSASEAEILEACVDQGVSSLVSRRVRALSSDCDWPPAVREGLAAAAAAEAAREVLCRRELVAVLNALSDAGVSPILLKGTALAYSLYPEPHLRPRCDTDLIVPHAAVNTVRGTLTRIGYASPPYCDGELLFHQVPFRKTDRLGVVHRLDLHWKISTQAMFADVLPVEELAKTAVPVPALGPHARTAGRVHALLLACLHAVMHHRNEERLIWMHDIHLLASDLPPVDFDRFAQLAIAGRVATVCAHTLNLVRTRLGTPVPAETMATLGAPLNKEATSAYLRPARRWRHELVSNLWGLPRWRDRRRLLREILFPAPSYMLDVYGVPRGSRGTVLLPLLYLHRSVRGGVNALVGRK